MSDEPRTPVHLGDVVSVEDGRYVFGTRPFVLVPARGVRLLSPAWGQRP